MARNIALAGHMASGKTLLADHLIEWFGYERLGFAAPLYEMEEIHKTTPAHGWRSALAGYVYAEFYGVLDADERREFINRAHAAFRETPREPGVKNRTLLQRIGHGGREIREDLWVRAFAKRVAALGPHARVVNDNLRYVNEAEALKGMGFRLLYVDAPEGIRLERYFTSYGRYPTEAELAHGSERELGRVRGLCDEELDNSGSPWVPLARLEQIASGVAV